MYMDSFDYNLLNESARNTMDPPWRLSEVEESMLLEVLVASSRQTGEGSHEKGLPHVTICSDVTYFCCRMTERRWYRPLRVG